MYEADEFKSGPPNAVKLGLGASDKSDSKNRKQMAKMSLRDRMKLEEEKKLIRSETKRSRVKGEGATREMSFIPKDVLRKKAAEEAKRQAVRGNDDQRKRQRRGIKDLGFKTPFNNKM